jgi:hypothetical protein
MKGVRSGPQALIAPPECPRYPVRSSAGWAAPFPERESGCAESPGSERTGPRPYRRPTPLVAIHPGRATTRCIPTARPHLISTTRPSSGDLQHAFPQDSSLHDPHRTICTARSLLRDRYRATTALEPSQRARIYSRKVPGRPRPPPAGARQASRRHWPGIRPRAMGPDATQAGPSVALWDETPHRSDEACTADQTSRRGTSRRTDQTRPARRAGRHVDGVGRRMGGLGGPDCFAPPIATANLMGCDVVSAVCSAPSRQVCRANS